MKATIPVGSYANIQPEITVSASTLEEANGYLLPAVTSLFDKYSDTKLKESQLTPVGAVEILKSFNEDAEVEFDRLSHTYSYKGNKLESASTFTARHTKKFDADGVSKACEPKWGVPQDTIKELWRSNGDAASGFGTAVHAVLEHYFKMREVGDTIMNNSSKEVNAALPNHPLLQRIVTELEALDTREGIEMQEVFVSNVEKGFCGLVDKLKILDMDKKICRIQDYKVAYDVDSVDSKSKMLAPFDKLPANKLSKYQVQLSVYANILQLSGWTVTGLDIFALGESWSKHELEILDVIK